MKNFNEKYESMSLQTLPNQKRTFYNHNHSQMNVTDIDGARSRFVEKPRQSREIFYNRNDDIERSRSNVLIPKSVNKSDRQLEVDDIKGTRTKVNKFTSTRRTNPLEPQYRLPNVEYVSIPEPKFIKDSMTIDDIEGTRMKETFVLKMERAGKVLEKDKSSFEKPKFVAQKDNFLFDVTDINMIRKKIQGDRCTNPLEPVYKIASSNNFYKETEIGPVEGSKTSMQRQRTDPINPLYVGDISGTTAKPKKCIEGSKNDQIPETKSGSLKKGISSNRKTNPLQPEYQYLGKNEIGYSGYSRPQTALQKFDAFIK